LRKELEIL